MKTLILLAIIMYLSIIPVSAELVITETEIDWDKLVACVIQIESGGNPNAMSGAGAIGLMQITPICLKEFNQARKFIPSLQLRWLWDSKVNIDIGTWYLKRLHYHYGCNKIEEMLAAYNGGITRLRRNEYNIGKMPKETRNYVKKVMRLYDSEK